MAKAEILLKELAEALDNAFISSWQTTSAWQNNLMMLWNIYELWRRNDPRKHNRNLPKVQ